MPPPRQFPGLGPLPEALGMTAPGLPSAGMRSQGLDLLRSALANPGALEEAYYGVPLPNAPGPQAVPAQGPDLGPRASGRAEPTVSDMDMVRYMLGIGGFTSALPNAMIGFTRTQGPMRMGASPAEAERYNMEGVGGGVENLIPDPRDPRTRHTPGILSGSLPFNFQ